MASWKDVGNNNTDNKVSAPKINTKAKNWKDAVGAQATDLESIKVKPYVADQTVTAPQTSVSTPIVNMSARKALNSKPITDGLEPIVPQSNPNDYMESQYGKNEPIANKNIGKAVTDLGASVLKGLITEVGNFPKTVGETLQGANNFLNNTKVGQAVSTLVPGEFQPVIKAGSVINQVTQPIGNKIRDVGQKFDRQSENNSALWNNTLSTAESFGRMAADIPAAIASGLPTPVIMGLTNADETYNENVAKGMKPSETLVRAVTSGTIEGGSEMIGGGNTIKKVLTGQWKELLKKEGKEVAEETMKKTLGSKVWEFVKDEILKEAGQEAGTEVAHDVADTVLNGAYNGQWNDGRTLKEDVSNALWAGYGGALMGAVGGGTAETVKTIANLPGLGQAEVLQDNGNSVVIQDATGQVGEVRKTFLQNADVQEVNVNPASEAAATKQAQPELTDDEKINNAIKEIDAVKADHDSGKIETKDYLAKLAEIDSKLYGEEVKTPQETTDTLKNALKPLQATENLKDTNTQETQNRGITETLMSEDGQATLNKIKADMKSQGINADFKVIKGNTGFHRDIKNMMQKLGTNVVFYKGDKVPNGFISNSVKNTIFIHSNGLKNDMVATTGHEFMHHLSKNYSKEYGELLNFAKTYFTEESKKQFLETYSNVPELQHSLANNENDLLEEMLADEMGNNFMDKNFWQRVYEHSKDLFEKLVEVAKKIVEGFTAEDKYETYVAKETAETLSSKFEQAVASVRKQVAEGKVDTAARITSEDGVQMSEASLKEAGIDIHTLKDEGLVVTNSGAVVDQKTAENMAKGYETPAEKNNISFSVRTLKDWADSFRNLATENKISEERAREVIETAEKMGEYFAEKPEFIRVEKTTKSKFGPLRANVEYTFTLDFDTTCTRTIRFRANLEEIERRIGKPLSENESRGLIEYMRAMGQMIPCTYCYVENKRMLMEDSYLSYMDTRSKIMDGLDEGLSQKELEKRMYGYKKNKPLPTASQRKLEEWMKEHEEGLGSINANDLFVGYHSTKTAVMDKLDERYEDNPNLISGVDKLAKNLAEEFNMDVNNKAVIAELTDVINEWTYNTYARIPHNFLIHRDEVVEPNGRYLSINRGAMAYAKSSSSAKGIENYEEYTDQLVNVSVEDKINMNAQGGIRKHSSNDFRVDHIIDYIQFFSDAEADKRGNIGWYGHTYTKSPEYVEIFAPTNDRINTSIAFYGDSYDTLRENSQEGMPWKEARRFRKKYKNVGSMAMVTNDAQLIYSLDSEWVDMIIPFHASGMKKIYYNMLKWIDYTSKQNETWYSAADMREMLSEAGVSVPKSAKSKEVVDLFNEHLGKNTKEIYEVKKDGTKERVKPHFLVRGQVGNYVDQNGNKVEIPGHDNNADTYFKLCREYGVNPRFYKLMLTRENGEKFRVTDHPGYVKLIKETARTDSSQEYLQAKFDNEAFQRVVKDWQDIGGYSVDKQHDEGTVRQFLKEYVGKNRKLGWLPDDAEYMKELREETIKQLEQNKLSEVFAKHMPAPEVTITKDAAKKNDTQFSTRTKEKTEKEKLIDVAKKEFGTTNDYREAGYLLEDGTMLDFSEKNDGGEPGYRTRDHREIESVVDAGTEYRTDNIYEFMKKANAVRLSNGDGYVGIEVAGNELLTPRQITALKRMAARKDQVIIEYTINHHVSNPAVYEEFDYPTASQISKTLDRIQDLKTPKQNENKASEYLQASQRMLDESKTKEQSNGLKLSTRSKEFKKWFGDSKVIDQETGEPKVIYHGTSKAGFNMFDTYGSNYGLFGQGSYFTEDPNIASQYTDKGRGNARGIYPVYARVELPLDMDKPAKKFMWEDMFPEIDFEGITTNESAYRQVEQWYSDEEWPKWEASEDILGRIQDAGYDGITHIGGSRVKKSDGTRHRVWITFEPNQVKSAIGNNGEYSNDNPDIRESVRVKERSHHQRYQEADATAPELLDRLTDESKAYQPISIKDTWDEAYNEVKTDIKHYRKVVDEMTEFRTAKDVATAEAVLYITQNEARALKSTNKALSDDMFSLAARIGEKIDAHFTKAGQVVSMGRLWKALGPEATIKFIRNKVNKQRTDKENERLNKGAKDLKDEIDNAVENAESEEGARGKVKDAIRKALGFKTGTFEEGELTEEQRGWIERLTEKALDGDLTKDMLREAFAARWKIPYFSGIMAANVMDLSEAIQGLEKGTDEYNIAVNRLNDYMNHIIEHDIWEHINTVENLAMLSGTKSMSRNVIGNVGRLAAYDVEKFGTALMDIGRSMFTKNRNRTVMMPNLKAQGKGILEGIKKDLKDFRYDTDSRAVEDDREFGKYIKYTNKPMNIFQRWVKLIMSDRPFSTAMINEVVSEAEKLAKKNGVKFDIVEAKQIAEEEANATFFNGHDQVIDRLLKIRREANFGKSRAWGIGSIVLKFAKVPYNISKFAVEREYHLAALKILYKSISTGYGAFAKKDSGYLKDEKFDSKAFMQDITKGLNGALIMYIGTQLFALGLIHVRPDDDDKDKKLLGIEKLTGTNKYQLNLSAVRRYIFEGTPTTELQEGDMLATLDWFTPLSILMIAGIKSQQMHQEKNMQPGDRNLAWYRKLWDKVMEPTTGMAEGIMEQVNTVLEMPMLQSLNKFKYSDSWQEGLMGMLADIPARFIPAPVKYVKEATDNTQRETYSDSNAGKSLNNVRAKLPGISKQLEPKIDMFGNNAELYQNARNNFLNIALNPAIVTRYKTEPESKKMLDVYQKYGIKEQIPMVAPKQFTAKKSVYKGLEKDENITLTASEYRYFQQEFGAGVKKLLGDFEVVDNKELQQKKANKLNQQYQDLMDEVKGKILKNRGLIN